MDFDKLTYSRYLREYNSLFRLFWDYCDINFSEENETAWISFDAESGSFLSFNFNPKFWELLSIPERIFVIAHELGHILLDHGRRSSPLIKEDLKVFSEDNINIALDLVVNEMLIRFFGFNREDLVNLSPHFVDNTFEESEKVRTDGSFEYYLNLLPKGKFKSGGVLINDHAGLMAISEESPELFDQLLSSVLPYVSEDDLKGLLGSELLDDGERARLAGHGLGSWGTLNLSEVQKKKKWETVIRRWERSMLRSEVRSEERWDGLDRRYASIFSTFKNTHLPFEMDIDDIADVKDRIGVFFFLDTSGSCYGLRGRFFRAARSLDERKFDIRCFCFDTQVKEVDIKGNRFYGGGGTYFHIIEDKIQEIIRKEKIAYPKAVWVITDGYGNRLSPEYPERWAFFLTKNGYKGYLPKESKVFSLSDYE